MMLIALIFFPKIGLHAFWDVLIPIAPLLLVLATGVWRNICPLATTALLPRKLNISKQKRMKIKNHGIITLVGVFVLLLAVPLRHLIFDTNGPVTAYFIISLAVIAVYMGYNYNWKSGWCSGLCPIHPVEKLYGSKVAIADPNAHCSSCKNCVAPCPDSIPAMNPLEAKKNKYHKFAGLLMIGGFPGYIWGWFQVKDYEGMEGFNHLLTIFAWPFMGFMLTFSLYMMLKRLIPESKSQLLTKIFATAAVSCYYWFRFPALFGISKFYGDGMLIDISNDLPIWFTPVFRTVSIIFFIWFIIIRNSFKQWAVRPIYEKRTPKKKVAAV